MSRPADCVPRNTVCCRSRSPNSTRPGRSNGVGQRSSIRASSTVLIWARSGCTASPASGSPAPRPTRRSPAPSPTWCATGSSSRTTRASTGRSSPRGKRVGTSLPTRERLCTLELTRALGIPSTAYSLEALCNHWQVPQARPHDADDDVRVLVEVLRQALLTADRQDAALPIRDPYARITLRRRLRRRYRRLRWTLRKRLGLLPKR